MKLLGICQDQQYESYLKSGLSGFLFPLERYAVDYEKVYSLSFLADFRKKFPTALCFVVMNKMIFHQELAALTNTLKQLASLQVTGVLFYDNSILSLQQQLGLSIPLFLNQTHMVTNSDTINFYHRQGCIGAVLSNEITKDEILTIKQKTSCSLMMLLVGYPVVAHSRRKLLTSYHQYHHLPKDNSLIIKESSSKQSYRLTETEFGTTFHYGKRFNASRCYQELTELAYGILAQDDLSCTEYQKLIENFRYFNKERIDRLVGNNTGFLYRPTIYRVKKHG